MLAAPRQGLQSAVFAPHADHKARCAVFWCRRGLWAVRPASRSQRHEASPAPWDPATESVLVRSSLPTRRGSAFLTFVLCISGTTTLSSSMSWPFFCQHPAPKPCLEAARPSRDCGCAWGKLPRGLKSGGFVEASGCFATLILNGSRHGPVHTSATTDGLLGFG